MASEIDDVSGTGAVEAEKAVARAQFVRWRTFQGREDAEMLQEKSAGWSSSASSRGDYDEIGGED